jgi:hypothetical protein
LLKILANAGCYGIYAEVNRDQLGKNSAKKIGIFSGEESRTEETCIVEPSDPWYFPPVASLITAGGRLLLAMLERMVTDAGSSYFMCDTDSMAIVSSKQGGLVPCAGGPHRTPNGSGAVRALSHKQTQQITERFTALNPYDPKIVNGSVLKIEDINFDDEERQRQLYGYGISAKRYALRTRQGSKWQLITGARLSNEIFVHSQE